MLSATDIEIISFHSQTPVVADTITKPILQMKK